MRHLIFLFCLVVICPFCVGAQGFTYTPAQFSSVVNSSQLANQNVSSYNDTLPLAIYDQWDDWVAKQNGLTTATSYEFKSIQDFIRVGIRPDTALVAPGYKYKVNLTLLSYSTSDPSYGQLPVAAQPVVLLLTYNPDSLKPYTDLSVYKFSNQLKYRLVLTGVYDVSGGNPVLLPKNTIAKNFFIESVVEEQRYDNNPFIIQTQVAGDNNNIAVSWTPTTPGLLCGSIFYPSVPVNPIEYELEWTYIDDYNVNTSTGNITTGFPGNNVLYDFRKNNTRIRTSARSFAIPMVYEHGAIVCRVRSLRPDPVQNYNGTIYSTWTLPDFGAVSIGDACFSSYAYLITSPHMNDSMNWQYTINFAEQGKYKHVINYFDGALKPRQTQTKINTDDQYIVAVDKAYDFEGRAAIQTLPVPVLQQSLRYRNDLMLNDSSGKPYKAEDFDRGCIEPFPDSIVPLSASAKAALYYSSSNPDKSGMQQFVPDAGGYPFVETIFSPDNTNKVLWQGNAGSSGQLWNKHGIQYQYVRATQPELDRLLGTEAGYDAFYPKQIVTDPNGQSSFSVFNPAGKVVMTGLLGDFDTTGKPLVHLDNFVPGTNDSVNLLRSIVQDKNAGTLAAQNSFYVDNSGITSLQYKVGVPPFSPQCSNLNLYARAGYDVSVTDECGNAYMALGSGSLPNAAIVDSVGIVRDTVQMTIDRARSPKVNSSLNKGKYIVTKQLHFSEPAIKDQVTEFIRQQSPTCYNDSNYFIKEAVNAADFPCQSEPEKSSCDLDRAQMLRELYPGAKYGKYTKNADSAFQFGADNSIFSVISSTSTGPGGILLSHGVAAYSTDVDSNYNLITTPGSLDPHWQCSYDDITYSAAYLMQHPWDLNRLWATPYNNSYLGYVYWSTSIYVSPGLENTIQMDITGDGNEHPAGTNGWDVWVNNSLYSFNSSIIPNLHAGWNQIKVRGYNTVGYIALSVIFTPTAPVGLYRYQAPCLTYPSPLIVNGVSYTNIASLPPDTLIKIFNDDIAAALLPMHPEYCRMLACDDGKFTNEFSGFKTWQQADAAGMFTLDGIINQDPIYTSNATPAEYNRLAYFANTISFPGQKIDEMALSMAYCNGGNANAQLECQSSTYLSWIQNKAFINDDVKQKYFEILQGLYLGNHNYLLQLSMDADTTNSCSPCGSYRMQLTGNPVFPKIFDANGYVDQDKTGIPQWVVDALNTQQTNNATPSSATPTGLITAVNDLNTQQAAAKVDAVMANLKACNLDAISVIHVHDDLYTALVTNQQTLTPALLASIFQVHNIPTSDLCHTFLVNYGLDQPVATAFDYECGSNNIYAGLKDFLNRPEVMTAIQNPGTYYSIGTLSASNVFEQKMQTFLWGNANYNQIVANSYSNNGVNYMQLNIFDPSFSVVINFYVTQKNSADPSFSGPVSSINSMTCINDDPASSKKGLVASYMAEMNCTVNGGNYPYYIWNDAIQMMSPLSDISLAGCITCMDLKTALQSFVADQSVYNYDIAYNHPLYERTLTNYLNYQFKRKYGFNDYDDLMSGCAISDQLNIKKYIAAFKVSTTNANVASVKNLIDGVTNGRELISYQILNPATSNVDLYLDVNAVSDDSVNWYIGQITQVLDGNNISYTYLPTAPTTIISKNNSLVFGSAYGNFASQPIQIWENGNYEDYTQYTRNSASYASEADHAQSLAGIKSILGNDGFAFYDANLFRSSDYNTSAKQSYLNQIYSQNPGSGHDDWVASIDPATLNLQVPIFHGRTLTYDDPYCSSNRTDLYSYQSNGSHPGYQFLNNVFAKLNTLYGHKLFPQTGLAAHIVNTDPQTYFELDMYKKANGDYWYKIFDKNKKLYNVYIEVPDYIDDILPYNYAGTWSVAQGNDSIKTFQVSLSNAAQSVTCTGHTDFPIGYSQKIQNVILLRDDDRMVCFDSLDCENDHLMAAIHNGQIAYQQYFDSLSNDMSHRMLAYLLDNTKDSLILTTQNEKYQFTLYYYDRVGNLVRTVPPAGVTPLPDNTLNTVASDRDSSTVNAGSLPTHKKVSVYRYNNLNQLVYQQTPDGAITYFFYDMAGRLVFSQNSKQRPTGYYSYVLYDDQSRVVETGEVQASCSFPDNPAILFDTTQCQYPSSFTGSMAPHPSIIQESALYENLDIFKQFVTTKVRRNVVITSYDAQTVDLGAIAGQHLSMQENLRNRVAAVYFFPSVGDTYTPGNWANYVNNPFFVTYYSYDINGNVKTVTYDYNRLDNLQQRYKRVDYDYDLLSGKVNMVSYNRNRADQFYHKYEYDADNRITDVYTSADGIIWNTDARYNYYKHGPLAQTKLGTDHLQSLEYAYTIQGWLKAINGDVTQPDLEMGKNGTIGDVLYARDAIAHALDYFNGDYKPIGNTPVTNLPSSTRSLFNGNIVRQTTSILGLGNMQRNYTYDQLQRLKEADNTKIDEHALTSASPTDIFKSTYSYDPDGNIKQLQRWSGTATGFGTSPDVDDFTYSYAAAGTDNKLLRVADNVAATSGTDLQPGQVTLNYQYDKIGNLVRDSQAHLRMTWTPTGKVDSIVNTMTGQKILFVYDGMGNRVHKEVITPQPSGDELHSSEYYVHDAQGNILATYTGNSSYALSLYIQQINADIKTQLGSAAITNFVYNDVSVLPTFQNQFTNYAVSNMSAWATQVTDAYPMSSYMAVLTDMINPMLAADDSYIDALRGYGTSVGVDYISAALLANQPIFAHFASQCLNNTGAGASFVTQWRAIMPTATNQAIWAYFGVAYTTNINTDATQLYNWVKAHNQVNALVNQMTSFVNNSANNSYTLAFYKGVIADNTIFRNAALAAPGSPFHNDIVQSLIKYNNPSAMGAFFAQWVGGRALFNGVSSLTLRLNTVYNGQKQSTINSFMGTVTDAGLVQLLAGVPGMTIGSYYQLVSSSSSLSAWVPSSGIASLLGRSTDSIGLSEHHIYGSSRLGIQKYDKTYLSNAWSYQDAIQKTDLSAAVAWYSSSIGDLIDKGFKDPWGHRDVSSDSVAHFVGSRYYELTDHLGNVLATVLDRKTGHISSIPSLYDYYLPDLSSATDYYPGGMPMSGRSLNGDKFRFGSQNQLKDDEIYGSGNSYAFKYRMEDARLNRFWSVDPLAAKYPYYSSYSFSGNRYIDAAEFEGLEPKRTIYDNPNVKTRFSQDEVESHKGNGRKPIALNNGKNVVMLDGETGRAISGQRTQTSSSTESSDLIGTYLMANALEDQFYLAADLSFAGEAHLLTAEEVAPMKNCFVRGTIVSTAMGLTPIEHIQVGDTVWAYDPHSNKTIKSVVLHAYTKQTSKLVAIETKQSTIFTTLEHRFYVNGVWKTARSLTTNDYLYSKYGERVDIGQVQIIDSAVDVYNFEVDKYHDYFVSEALVLVHNDCNETYDVSRINLAKGRTGSTPLRSGSGQPVSAGWDHVVEGHFDRPVTNNRSVFSIDKDDLRGILQSKTVIQSPVAPIAGGQYERTVDVGRMIGNATLKDGGGATSWIKVFTDRKGNLITTYPIAAPSTK